MWGNNMDTETKMLILKTLILNTSRDFFMKNELSPKAAYLVMMDVCSEFQKAVLEDIIQSTVSVEEAPQEQE